MTKKLCTVEELARHARAIAKAFRVALYEVPGLRLEESVAERLSFGPIQVNRVRVPPITSEVHYAATMHEIGHLVHPVGILPGRDQNEITVKMCQEEAAWEWARHYAIDWSPAMEHTAQLAFGTYKEGERQAQLHKIEAEASNNRRESDARSWLKRILS